MNEDGGKGVHRWGEEEQSDGGDEKMQEEAEKTFLGRAKGWTELYRCMTLCITYVVVVFLPLPSVCKERATEHDLHDYLKRDFMIKNILAMHNSYA